MATIVILTPKPPPRPAGQPTAPVQGGEWEAPDNLSLANQLRWIANQIDGVNPQL